MDGSRPVVNSEVEDGSAGISMRTMSNFMCGTAEVAIATSSGFVGHKATDDGLNEIHAFEWGARFWLPNNRKFIDIEAEVSFSSQR